MFRRRNPLSVLQRIRAVIWPKRGFSRIIGYMMHRVLRMSGTPHSIACGLACGASVSFTPFIGLHLIIAVAISYPLGGSISAALIGTLIGNPWTFPIILLNAKSVGDIVLTFLNLEDHLNLSTISAENTEFLSMLISTSIGGSSTAIFVWPFFYGATYYTIVKWRSHRQARILKKARVHPSAH